MERASRLIGRLRLPVDAISPGELARKAWPAAVGKKVVAHTRVTRMAGTRLVVEVEDKIWQRQLFSLTRQIVRNLEKSLGPGMVEDIEFRVVPPRRGPQRAEQATAAVRPADEAEQIADPVLRMIYKSARKKALA